MPWKMPDEDREVLGVLLFGTLLLTLYVNHGTPTGVARLLDAEPAEMRTVVTHFAATLLLLGLLPAAVWRNGLRRPLAGMGLGREGLGLSAKLVLVGLPLIVLVALVAARIPEVRAEYPLARALDREDPRLVAYEAAYVLYYIGYEAFFRGFLLFGTERRGGPTLAVGLTTLVTTALHLGKPGGEVIGAAIVGIVFGAMALRTRSILAPLLLHIAIGVGTDLSILLGAGGPP